MIDFEIEDVPIDGPWLIHDITSGIDDLLAMGYLENPSLEVKMRVINNKLKEYLHESSANTDGA